MLLTRDGGGTSKVQPTEGGDDSVMTRVVVRAQKKRDFRWNELQGSKKYLGEMLVTLVKRSTLGKDELRSKILHVVKVQMAAFASQRPPGQ